MNQKYSRILLFFVLTGSLLLAACSNQAKPTTAPEATVDTNLIYTQAAQTIEASMKLTEASRPTETATLEPTATQAAPVEPTATQAAPAAGDTMQATATATSQGAINPPLATATATGVVAVLPTATATRAAAANPPTTVIVATATPVGDKVEFVSLSPSRGTQVKKNASWDMVVTIKNAGGITWKQYDYKLRFGSGEQMGSPSEFLTQKDVKPGESYSFVFTMKAPDSTGEKKVYWVLIDSEGREAMYIDFWVNVVD